MTELRELLERFADDDGSSDADALFDSAYARAGVRRRTRRVRRSVLAAAVLIVLAVGTIAVVTRPRSDTAITTIPPVSTPTQATGATASELAAGTWSLIPAAPISENRDGASVVWTGHELIVWGGQQTHGDQLYVDGAAYNPDTHTWRLLPPSPLLARIGQSAVWTGNQLIIWGGEASPTQRAYADGAAYSPVTNTWNALPPAPIAPRAYALAVWTGSRMLVLGGGSVHTAYTDGATYDPASRKWQRIDTPTAPNNDRIQWSVATAIGSPRVLAWSLWSKAPTREGQFPPGGADLFVYNEDTNSWTSEPKTPNAAEGTVAAVWTGHDVIVVSGPTPCDGCSRPFNFETTAEYDPDTNQWTPLPAIPQLHLSNEFASTWTGRALFSWATSEYADAYDPALNVWTPLPRAPRPCGDQPVWTGTQVLVYCPNTPPQSGTSNGLAFTPSSQKAPSAELLKGSALAMCVSAFGENVTSSLATTVGVVRSTTYAFGLAPDLTFRNSFPGVDAKTPAAWCVIDYPDRGTLTPAEKTQQNPRCWQESAVTSTGATREIETVCGITKGFPAGPPFDGP